MEKNLNIFKKYNNNVPDYTVAENYLISPILTT